MTPWAEAALFAASRAEHAAEVIRPALARGADVVCDRFVDSSLAYQGIARGLGLDLVLQLNLTVLEGLLPDRTFVVAVDAATAAARREGKPDRIEQEGDGFQAEVGRAYEQLAERFPERVELVDGAQPPDRDRGGGPEAAGRMSFETLLEQDEAKRLLSAALADEPAHAYLFHGPAGVGKRRAALAFAGELLGDRDRVERLAHPDLYLLEPLGDMIRIDEVRELRRDLHMRPFEADRRVYLVFGSHLLNAEAADALLKDLEEPPPYAVVVLVADELGPLPETIRSRCQLVPFRRLSERAIRAEIERRAPGLAPEQATAFARVAAGRLDRVERLLDPEAAGGERSCSRSRAPCTSTLPSTPTPPLRQSSRSPPSGPRRRRRPPSRRSRAGSCPTARPSSTSSAPSAGPSGRRSCSPSRSSPPGTATWWSWGSGPSGR